MLGALRMLFHSMKVRRLLSASALVLPGLLLLSACRAGPPPARTPEDRHNDLVAKRSAQLHAVKEAAGDELSAVAEELEAELFLTDAGKVIARAIRAHGGWDAWTRLDAISYSRDRVPVGAEGKPSQEERPSSTQFTYHVDAEGRFAPAPGSEDPHEQFFFPLPFALARRNGRKEYLGVESDARSGEAFEKIRCERGRAGEGWFVAYFDSSTYVLKRILEEKEGVSCLTLFSSWVEVGGVKAPTKRSLFRLRSRFQHRDMRSPDQMEVLRGLGGQG